MQGLFGRAYRDDLCIADVTCGDKASAHGPDQIAHACDFLACQKLEHRVFAGCARTAMHLCAGVNDMSQTIEVHDEQALFQAGIVGNDSPLL